MVGDYIMAAVEYPGLEGRLIAPAISTPASIISDLMMGKDFNKRTQTLQRITRPPFGVQPGGPSFADLNQEQERVSVLQ